MAACRKEDRHKIPLHQDSFFGVSISKNT